MTPKPPTKPRDPCLIGDGEPETCHRCRGTGLIGDGQGHFGECRAGSCEWKFARTLCPVCLGRGVVSAR